MPRELSAHLPEASLKRNSPDENTADDMHRASAKLQRTLSSPSTPSTPSTPDLAAASFARSATPHSVHPVSIPRPAVAATLPESSATAGTSVPATLIMSGLASTVTVAIPAAVNPSINAALRALYTELVRTRYPGWELENDFELFALGAGLAMASHATHITMPAATGTTPPSSARPPNDAHLTCASRASARTVSTTRQLFTERVRTRYPNYQPRNDFELFTLGTKDFSHVQTGQLSAQLANEWAEFIARGNEPEVAMASITTMLARPAEITGEKPRVGDPGVSIIALPGSPYSLRMWPGSRSRREYCLDFVYADSTDRPLNIPEGYDLVAHVPMGSLPWLGLGAQTLHSIEHNFGICAQDMREGEEKYILRDGLVCVMSYTAEGGDREVRFEVPIRPDGVAN